MKTFISIITCFILAGSASAQKIEGMELGFDGYFGASTNGGSFTIGAKYGFRFNEHFIAGPSARHQLNWNNNATTGVQGSYNVFGGGVWAHGRFGNVLFAGAEFEMMRTPFSSIGSPTIGPSWVPTLFIGGGYSQEFNEKFRLNAGVMYDVINHTNSPFRAGYFMRNNQQKLIPLIYRLAFFIRIGEN